MGVRGAIFAAILVGAVATACSPIVRNHGYTPSSDRLAEITPGIDTAESVVAKIGRPGTGGLIRNDSWFYVSSTFETMAYRAPELTERKVIVVSFTPEGIVETVDQFGMEEGRIINLVTRTTPTFGRRMGILEQIFGNIGNIGAEQALGSGF